MSEVGNFIVVFNDGVNSDEITNYINELTSSGGELKNRFDENGILNGFAAKIPASFLQQLQADTDIAYIEPDSIVTTQ